MRNLHYSRYLLLLLPLCILFGTGCASKNVAWGPNFSAVENHLKRIAIISPEMRSFEISGGGLPEYRVDWSRAAARNLSLTVKQELKIRQFEGVLVYEKELGIDLDTILSFVRQNVYAIQHHLYGKHSFIPQIDTFDYCVGPLADLCDQLAVDAVLFAFGTDEEFSKLRVETLSKMANVKTAKAAFWGGLSMILTGYGSFTTYQVPKEQTRLSCVVADRRGRIVWYEQYHKADDSDLGKMSDARALAKAIVDGLRRKVE